MQADCHKNELMTLVLSIKNNVNFYYYLYQLLFNILINNLNYKI